MLGQTPSPNASGVDRPRVSLLLSQAEEPGAKDGIVMPSLTGLPLMSAAARASAAGLRVVSAEEIKQTALGGAGAAGSLDSTSGAVTPAAVVAVPGASTATVVAQTPAAGYRVAKGDPVRLAISYQETVPAASP